MHCPDAQFPGRLLPLGNVPLRYTTGSLPQLTDDSLLVLLSFLPLGDLLCQVHLTCKRVHALLPLVLRRCPSLRLYRCPEQLQISSRKVSKFKYRESAQAYALYLQTLLNQAPLPKGVPFKEKSIQVRRPEQWERLSQGKLLVNQFPNLTRLCLSNVRLPVDSLLHLLTAYQDSLISLSIRSIWFIDHQTASEELSETERKQGEAFRRLWPVLDSLTVLCRLTLALGRFLGFDKHPLALPRLLPRLIVFTFLPLTENPFPIVEALDGERLTQLHLYNLERYYFEGALLPLTLADLFTSKASFGSALTHLTLTFQWNDNGVTVPLLQTVVTFCSSLGYLDMTIAKQHQFDSLLPSLIKLPHLTSLGLHTKNVDFLQRSSPQEPLPTLTSLARLSLEMYLNVQTFPLLRSVCPNLRRLYLDQASLQIEPNLWAQLKVTYPESGRKLANSRQMATFIDIINSFAYLPKINFPYELK